MQKRLGLSLTSNSEDHPTVFAPANHRRLHNRRFNSRVVDWRDDAKKRGHPSRKSKELRVFYGRVRAGEALQ